MIQISKITFKDIILEDITFSDGEDLMKLLKGLGKENYEIFDEELQAPRFDKRQDACDEKEDKEVTIEDIKIKRKKIRIDALITLPTE